MVTGRGREGGVGGPQKPLKGISRAPNPGLPAVTDLSVSLFTTFRMTILILATYIFTFYSFIDSF